MKILLSGASGLLGNEIRRRCLFDNLVVDTLDRSKIEWKGNKANMEMVALYDVIIHAAANTNVELCEVDIYDCYRDNTFLTEKLVNASITYNVKFVYISSTGVYGDGVSNRPYHEYDNTHPTTQHHAAKLLSEKYISKVISNHLIIRTGWLFGGGIASNDFISKIFNCINDQKIKSNTQQIGTPTYIKDVADRLLMLIKNDEIGIFNVVNEGCASRYSYVHKIVELFESSVEVHPVDAKDFNRVAPVSNNESAENLKMRIAGYPKMARWTMALEDYIIATYGK